MKRLSFSLFLISALALSSFSLLTGGASVSQAMGLSEQPYVYYVIPPQSEVQINEQTRENLNTKNALMFFRKQEQELLSVPQQTVGVRLFTSNAVILLNTEAQLELHNELELKAGSVLYRTKANSSDSQRFEMGPLEARFEQATFLAFLSGDGSEMVVKVIEGEMTLENSLTQQEIVLSAGESTSADAEGRLLVPVDFELPDAPWWEKPNYKAAFEQLPLADAGPDQRVIGRQAVTLNGAGSQFQTGDIFEWTLIQGPRDNSGREITEVSFNSLDIVKPLFTPKVDGEYHFELQISNQAGQRSNSDQVVIYVGRDYLKPLAIFPDVPTNHPNNLAITYLYKKNVMRGSEDPETGDIVFRPDDTINRVEILKSLFENQRESIPSSEEIETEGETIFEDVKASHWFGPYVYRAKQRGMVKGNNGFYRPADKVNLAEALKIIVEAYEISLDSYQSSKKPYPDAEEGAWYNPYFHFAKTYNLIDANAEGKIVPAQELSRANAAEIFYRIDSINLLEKRGFLAGKVSDTKDQGVANAEVYIYLTSEAGEGDIIEGFLQKGELYYKTTTANDGSFGVSLPIHTKYYVEAISENDVSNKSVITEVKEGSITTLYLEIERE